MLLLKLVALVQVCSFDLDYDMSGCRNGRKLQKDKTLTVSDKTSDTVRCYSQPRRKIHCELKSSGRKKSYGNRVCRILISLVHGKKEKFPVS